MKEGFVFSFFFPKKSVYLHYVDWPQTVWRNLVDDILALEAFDRLTAFGLNGGSPLDVSSGKPSNTWENQKNSTKTLGKE